MPLSFPQMPYTCLHLSTFYCRRREEQSISNKQPNAKAELQTPRGQVAELSPNAVDSAHGSNRCGFAISEVTKIAVF